MGRVYRWNGYAEEGPVHSLLRYAETHGERLRHKYLAWIHELGEYQMYGKRLIDHLAFHDGLSYWWMTLLAEKSPYKSPITDAIRLLALEEIVVQRRPNKLRLVSANRILHEVLRGLCQRLGIAYEWQRPLEKAHRQWSLGRIYRALPHSVQALISLVRYLLIRWPLKHAEKSGWFGGHNSIFFCSYFDNIDPKAAEQGRFHSYYWLGLQALLNRIDCKSNWLQLFIPCDSVPTYRAAMIWVNRFNQRKSEQCFHTFLDAYLSPRIVLHVLKRWTRLTLISWRLREIKHAFFLPGSQISLWPLMRRDWHVSMRGPAAIDNLLQMELFDVALRSVPHQVKGLYLSENQAWERALIHAWRKHRHGRLIAVPHSTVRFWDLRYFTDSRTVRSSDRYPMPQADLVALNGKAAVDAYLSVDYPKEDIVRCEALRYGNLTDVRVASNKVKGAPIQVLILGDYLPSTTVRMLRLLEAAASQVSDHVAYTVKSHPNFSVKTSDYSSLHLNVVTDPLGDILHDFDIAYASNSTSAVVEAYLAALPVVVALDETELNFSPLRGRSGVCFVSTPEELAQSLQTLADKCIATGRDPNDFFFLDPELPKWSHLLEN